MGSPLGAIYSTNITPDPDTGIGNYTRAEFDRAVRRGIAKDGHHLYPAMPYPSYARLSDADVGALYAFFMNEVPPVHQANRRNEIPAVLSFRFPLVVWNAFFAGAGRYVPDPGHDAEWNRGAYLVQGLGHCGACHTPRGPMWQEEALSERGGAFLAGAELDGWSATDLRGNVRTGLGTWSAADIVQFLRSGHNQHGSAFGSMTDVLNNSTPYLSDADLHAVAVYLKSLPPTAAEPAPAYDRRDDRDRAPAGSGTAGATLYAANCATCHGTDGRGFTPSIPGVAGNPVVLDKDPSSLINLVLNGAAPLVIRGTPLPYRMPEFRLQFSDQQIADVVSFIRAGWGNNAAPVTAAAVASLRGTTDPSSDRVVLLKMR